MKKLWILALFLGLAAPLVKAQSTATTATGTAAASTPTTQPPSLANLPTINVSLYGGYSNTTGAATNNGTFTSQALTLGNVFKGSIAVRNDVYMLANPTIVIDAAGPELRWSVNTIFPNLSGNYPVVNQMELFINGKVGDSYQTDTAGDKVGKNSLAYGFGGGVDIRVSTNVVARVLDISYIRSPLLQNGGIVLGNHLSLEAGLGLRF